MKSLFRNHLLAVLGILLAACSANSGPGKNGGSSINSSTSPSTTTTVVTAAAAAPAVSLSISPRAVEMDQTATAAWTAANATSCTASGAWSGALATSDTSGETLGPFPRQGTYTYDVTCAGPGGSTATGQPLYVGAVPAPVIQFNLSPLQIQPGDSATIVWSTTDATACTGSGGTGSDGWSASQPTTNLTGFNTQPITTAGEYPYNLTCAGPGGTAEQSVILTVSMTAPPAPPTVSFTAQPTVIAPGDSTLFTWNVTNSTDCSATGGDGSEGWSGAQPISSTGTVIGPLSTAGDFTYTLTCTGPGGSVSKSISILVSAATQAPAVTATIDVSPQQITAGSAAALTWSSSNATTCTATGSWSGYQAPTGTAVSTGTLTVPGQYSYTLNCTGDGGSTGGTATASLIVNPAPATVNSLTASPTTTSAGQNVVLSWNSTGATTCTASGGSGHDNWAGSVPVSSTGMSVGPVATGTIAYSLTCTGPGGAGAPASVNVTGTGNAAAATVASFQATPSSIQVGQSTQLSWTSTNATSCSASGATGWSGMKATSSTGTPMGPINTAGTYTYTLVCTGSGGTGSPVSVTVDVTSAPPAAAIVSFAANPGSLEVGQTTQLTWTTTNATTCTASAGTGSDGWNGSVATSSTGTPITLNSAGNFTYALTCSGTGGASAPASVTVNVSTSPPVASINSFTATPGSVQTNQTITLAWSSAAATSCTASGGTGSDNWGGTVGTSSTGTQTLPLSPAGTYTYTLTCSGTGGTSPPSSATVNVTTAPAPASINSFTAAPTSLVVGQSTQLVWSSSNATSCTASGGTGSDGWNGSVGTSSTGLTVGPLNTVGNYVYTLTCTGAGGLSAPVSLGVTVNAAPVPATITSFTATPSAITTGQSSTLAWSTSGATSCTATGGTGSDGWTDGTVGTSSTATVVTPASTATYTLVCSGPGGQSAASTVHVTVTAPVAGKPTVSLAVNGGGAAQIQPGQAPTLTWTTTNSASCTASGGTGSDGWSGSEPTSSAGVALSAISTPGVYTYTLTCTGTGGTGTGTVTLTVISSSSANCGIGEASTLLQSPAATASWAQLTGVCVLGCGVLNLNNLIDTSTTNFATEFTTVGLGATIWLQVTDQATTFPAGRTVGFIVAENGALLSLSALTNISVVTLLGGTVQETATVSGLLQLQALGLLYDPDAGYLAFRTTKPFNSVALVVNSLASVGSSFKVYGACATLQ